MVRVLRGLGDLLCAVPALRALRAARPDAPVTLVGATGTDWFVARFSRYVDDLLAVTGFPGLPEAPGDAAAALRVVAEAHARSFRLALQLHGSGVVSNPLTALLGAPTMAGHRLPGQWCPDPATFPVYSAAGHEVHRLLGVTRALGLPDQGDHLEFPLTVDDLAERLELVRRGVVPASQYACLHPGASVAARRWSPDGYAAAGDHLARQGLTVVLTGTADERPITAAVAARMSCTAVDLAGRTSLGGLAAVLDAATVLVTNDTGVSHLAAALGTPSVVIFLASDPGRWAPLDTVRHRAVVLGPVAEGGGGDGGRRDPGTRDGGRRDAGTRDGGRRDAGTRDAGTRDAGTRDGGTHSARRRRPDSPGALTAVLTAVDDVLATVDDALVSAG